MLSCLQKSRVRGQYNLPSTVSNVEPQSKTNMQTKARSHGTGVCCLQQQKGAGAELPWQHQDILQSYPWLSAQGLATRLQNPSCLQYSRDAAGSRVTIQPTYSQQSGATVWTPSSNDFGILVGGESWSVFQTSCAGGSYFWW